MNLCTNSFLRIILSLTIFFNFQFNLKLKAEDCLHERIKTLENSIPNTDNNFWIYLETSDEYLTNVTDRNNQRLKLQDVKASLNQKKSIIIKLQAYKLAYIEKPKLLDLDTSNIIGMVQAHNCLGISKVEMTFPYTYAEVRKVSCSI